MPIRLRSTLSCFGELAIGLSVLALAGCSSITPQSATAAVGQRTGPGVEVQSGKPLVHLVHPDGKSEYEIVVATNASVAAKEAGSELQRLIEVVTGARLPIMPGPTAARRQIFVGAHPLSEVGIDATRLGLDAFELRVRGGQFQMLGRDDDEPAFLWYGLGEKGASAGTYFAVVEFARQFLGVEWFMPGPLGEDAPPRKGLAVPADLHVAGRPFFATRYVTVLSDGKEEETKRWARNLRLGSPVYVNVQHSWRYWLPPKVTSKTKKWTPHAYGSSHPEFFALRNGKRINYHRSEDHGGQLCVSNPDVASVFAENIIAYAKRTGRRAFSLSCNDGADHCECADCAAWDVVKYDPKTRTQEKEAKLSDRMTRFSNRVAELVLKEVPDATFGLYAYHATRSVPISLVPHPAIVISDVYNGVPYLFHSPVSRGLMEDDVRQWRQKAGQALLTSYYFDDGHHWGLPWSTLDVQGWMVGVMAEYPASSGIRLNYGKGAPVGLMGPDPWVVSQLLWDPRQSVDALADKFYLGAFGAMAGPLVREYFKAIDDAMRKAIAASPQTGQNVEMRKVVSQVIPAYEAVRPRCRALIDQAVDAVASEPERYRWRVGQIARSWSFAEVTLDAVAAAKAARLAAPAERVAAWEKAVRLGKQRQKMLADADNVYAVAPWSVNRMDRILPLGVVTEMPSEETLTLEVPTLAGEVLIDGKLDEPVWGQAARSSEFRENRTNGTARATSRVRVFCGREGLHLGFECDEPLMDRLKTMDNPKDLWSGDVVEAFLIPTGDLSSHVQFSVNPNGIGKEMLFRGDRGTDETWKTEWAYAASKGADSWTVEIFLPWKSLGLAQAPKVGDEWYGDFFRERYTGQVELSGWSPTGSSFATPMKFGLLRFIR